MKQLTIIILFLIGTNCFSQDTEFGKSNNGLIYADTTIQQLKFIVDSLNLKFKVCDLNKIYLSKFQAKGHYISLKNTNIKNAIADMDANIPFEEFVKKHEKSVIDSNLLVIKYNYTNYRNTEIIEFSNVKLGKSYEHEISFDSNLNLYQNPLKNHWVYNYQRKTDYSEESVYAFYFIEEFHQQALPEKYAKMVQYSDCMIDTSTQVFTKDAKRKSYADSDKNYKSQIKFLEFINKKTKKPSYKGDYDETSYSIYNTKLEKWDSSKINIIDSIQKNDEKFSVLLQNAIDEALENGNSSDEFEEYVGQYYSKKTELQLKRNRIVVGGCSMDNSPRLHAVNIAKLSAETINWEIFLRSHLDIMNDRFERMSDGSYAWGKRKTYIKELEILDINVFDLLLGICLRIENPSDNHYNGSIWRLGKALAETENPSEIESKILEMISDNQLDDFNRVIGYYLFVNYNNNLEDKNRQEINLVNLNNALKNLPNYISTKIIKE